MEITYAFVCDYAMVSREGKTSILGIFSSINAPQLPWPHPQLHIAFELEMSYAELNQDFQIRIVFVDADGNSIFKTEGKFNVQGEGKPGQQRPRISQTLQLNNIRFIRAGPHDVNIFINDQLKGNIPFEVIFQPLPAPQIEGTPPPGS